MIPGLDWSQRPEGARAKPAPCDMDIHGQREAHMKRRIAVLLGVATFAVAALAGPVAADQGGVPNENACHGQLTSHQVTEHGGQSLKELAAYFSILSGERVTVGEVHQYYNETCHADGET